MTPRRSFRRYLPVFVALLSIGAIYAIVSSQLRIGPRGLIPGLLAVLLALLMVTVRRGRVQLGRSIGITILAVVTLAEALTTSVLVGSVISAAQPMSAVPHTDALTLLRDAALIWLVNILTFSLWYWEIDGGGPGQRHYHGYHSADFVFPQATLPQAAGSGWLPHYIDYLFLAFNTSTAFSPTDTLVLSPRAKLLMISQSLISLTLLAIIAARAINTL